MILFGWLIGLSGVDADFQLHFDVLLLDAQRSGRTTISYAVFASHVRNLSSMVDVGCQVHFDVFLLADQRSGSV